MSDTPRWQQVSGNAAERYERDLVPAMFAPWAPLLIDLAGVKPGERVLDVACGTGVVTRAAAARVGGSPRVVGLDINPAMLTVARSIDPDMGIDWIEASALAMPLSDGAFDVVLCQQGLQQFPDRPAALAEMHRVLAPAGRLALSVWSRIEGSPGMAGLVEALERHAGIAAADNRRAPFALGDVARLEQLVTTAGFADLQVQTMSASARFPSPEAFAAAQIASTPLSTLGALNEETLRLINRDIRAALTPYLRGAGELIVPMQAHVVVAHAPV